MVCSSIPEPCGGDIVGIWEVTDTCFDTDPALALSPMSEPECQDVLTAVDMAESGAFEFRDDGTVAKKTVLSGSMSMRYTDACIKALGGVAADPTTCQAMENSLEENAQTDPTSPIAGGTCTLSGQACVCDATMRPETKDEETTYEASGTTLSFPLQGKSAGYCVSGDQLTIVAEPNSDGVRTVTTLRRS